MHGGSVDAGVVVGSGRGCASYPRHEERQVFAGECGRVARGVESRGREEGQGGGGRVRHGWGSVLGRYGSVLFWETPELEK